MEKLLTQDMLGVKPTELCTCSNKNFKESKFIESIAKSTQIFFEKTFRRKDYLEVIQDEVPTQLEQEFGKEVPPDQINHETPE